MSSPASAPSRDTGSFAASPGSFVGKRVGPYTICLELSSGGMATVFLARTGSSAGRPELVALKVIHRHLAESRDFVEMFADEVRITSQLRHHNVCEVYGQGKLDGTCYLAMEYLMGEPLSAVLRRTARRTLDVSKHAALAVRVAADACAGLHAAHSLKDGGGKPLNVVHRDVSPDNLFVTYAGVTKVVDFGLVSAKHQTHRTRTGIIKGKFAYVCPEALTGAKVDRRADVWSLGVVLWELLTGRRLFRGDSDLQTLAAVAEAPIQRPSAVRPGLPPELDAPVLRALSRNPSKRQRSANELARELLNACPAAAALGEAEIAEWMSSLFPNERRWKSQVTELVQACSRPDWAFAELDLDDALTRVKTLPALAAVARSRSRRSWAPAAVVGVSSLLGAGLLGPWHLWGAEPALASEAATSTPRAATAAPSPLVVPELRAGQLTEGNGYVLEIADPVQGKRTVLLRIRPDQPTPSPRKTAIAAPAPPATPPAPVAREESYPPAWLREVMAREKAKAIDDLMPLAARDEPGGSWRTSGARSRSE
jgi:serine/threonine protein kinase